MTMAIPGSVPSAAATAPPAAPVSQSRIPLWVDLRHVPVNKRLSLIHAVDEMAAEHVLLEKNDPHLGRPGLRPLLVDGHSHLKEGHRTVGRIIKVRDAKSQARAAEAEGIVVVEAEDWRVIPLENLIAARTSRPGTLFAVAHNAQEVALFAQALESGVHGIVLVADNAAEVFAADRLLRALHKPQRPQPATPSPDAPPSALVAGPAPLLETPSPTPAPVDPQDRPAPDASAKPSAPLKLEAATVTRVADGGFGDRVCVDCTSQFADGEGLLIGSTARSFILVHAETPTSGFVAPRPFRVNAGAIHSYILAPQGKTRYLSELRAGDTALAVGRNGATHIVTIGRCKIERRTHTLVHWRTADGEAMAMLQTAETIRLVRPDGSLVVVTALRPGDQVLVHHEEAARHFGMAVTESLEER